MLHLPFNVYPWFKESEHTHRGSFADITNVAPALQCIIYLDSKRVSVPIIEAVLPTLPMLYLPLNVYSWFKESRAYSSRSSFVDITNVAPSLQCISWFKESKHTHRGSIADYYQCCTFPSMYILIQREWNILIEAVLPTLPMLHLPFNVYLDSKRVSILIEAVLPTLPMLHLPFNVYLDSKRVSILIEAVLPTLPMLYLPFNVYLDSKRVSILIEAALPTLPIVYNGDGVLSIVQKQIMHQSNLVPKDVEQFLYSWYTHRNTMISMYKNPGYAN